MTDEAMAANLNGDESSLRGSAGCDRRESIRRNRVVPSGDDEGRDGQLLQREVVCGDVRHEPSKIAPSHRFEREQQVAHDSDVARFLREGR